MVAESDIWPERSVAAGLGSARQGVARPGRRGAARLGWAWEPMAHLEKIDVSKLQYGMAWPGWARRGEAWHGKGANGAKEKSMRGKTGRLHRTTITIPIGLKDRMNKVGEHVNWSAVATAAFEAKLASIALNGCDDATMTLENRISRIEKLLGIGETQKDKSPSYDHGACNY